MTNIYNEKIGELCREGKPVYYTYLPQGTYLESPDRGALVQARIRWFNRDWTGDYLDD